MFAFANANAADLTFTVNVPVGTKACYIAGDMTVPSWSQVAMTKVTETQYTITLAATTTQGCKYCSGPGWGYVEKTAEGKDVSNRNWSATDVVAKWAAIYDPAVVPVSVTYDVTVPATDKCYFNGAATSWAFTEMTKISDTHFTLTVSIVPTLKDGYKYSAGSSWNYEEQTAGGGDVANRTYSANDVVAKWKSLPTSLDVVETASASITTSNSTITAKFEGIAKVEVYTITGTLVSSVVAEGEVSQSVNSGAYIVVVGEKATKVLVK